MIHYQPEAEMMADRNRWTLPALPPVCAACAVEDDVDLWFSDEWRTEYVKHTLPRDLVIPAPHRAPTLEERFREQADKWERETKFISSVTKRINHPSYTAILGMREEPGIVRLLLRDLQENRRPWFWALSYITQSNPIQPEDAGKMDKMIAAWVKWGKAQGYLR